MEAVADVVFAVAVAAAGAFAHSREDLQLLVEAHTWAG